jgi:hypothetical protein
MSLAQQGRRVVLAGLLLLGGVYVRALAFTPVERFQGVAQKIFYLHVPAAVTTELAVILVGLAGVFFLFLKDPRHGVRRHRADDGTHLGQAHLGHVVDLGRPAHQYAVPLLPADQLSRAAGRGE